MSVYSSRSSLYELSGGGDALPSPVTSRNCISASMKRIKYVRRLFKFQQMDFQFALWQMYYLFISPQKVYRNFHYRKQTKYQLARDDPAFLILFAAWLLVAAVIQAIVLQLTVWQFVKLAVILLAVDCLGKGLVVASVLWFAGNRYFVVDRLQDIEWGFAFDVHLNALFPSFVTQHVWMLLFYNSLINHEWFVSCVCGNTFWLISQVYYVYITFLGYKSLPFVRRTSCILWLLPLVIGFYVITLVLRWNLNHAIMLGYKNQVM